MVDVKFEQKFENFVSLEDLKADSKLEDMLVVQRGQRLSIQPVEKKHFDHVVKLGNRVSGVTSAATLCGAMQPR